MSKHSPHGYDRDLTEDEMQAYQAESRKRMHERVTSWLDKNTNTGKELEVFDKRKDALKETVQRTKMKKKAESK